MTENQINPEADLDAALDALVQSTDSVADEAVEDALDIDSAEEANAAAAAIEDEETEADADAAVAGDAEAEATEGEDGESEETDSAVDPLKAFKKDLRRRPGKWFVIHTYAGYERKVKSNLWNRREVMGTVDDIYEIQVPMEEVMEVKNGQRKMVTRVRIPGYVLVRMNLNEDTWSVVRHTPGVTGFVGNAHNPVPLRLNEAFEMLKSTVELDATATQKGSAAANAVAQGQVEIDFEIGETITIKSGSFEGLPGTISEINPASGKLTVLVSLFERETPVELGFDQVTKLA
ncbi:transcription termination/antitermination protein NusG [Leucobacter sp. cx-42]|uniref:transcription termination/antitermination protein NusG n=1 Tax=unclassified Leucobacter TaxID=2621730 RepID=UPI00165E5B14|nr:MULTISPECIES: transcription termination/antitermination protein NusG [unclassified Leucobacter]MBC9953935.1 transcription termination/antitermination protein NusG [Leucobacter sp. cx-42]